MLGCFSPNILVGIVGEVLPTCRLKADFGGGEKCVYENQIVRF